ncbi:MAG: hydroxymethylbilane synthase [Acidimicrobiia bacterium]|nr:hydroxymethylbilane synthase [Acidimicrobiia bacterium]
MLVRLATRASPLARWQTERVAAMLEAHDPAVHCELVTIETVADQRLDIPIWQMGGKGVFVTQVQALVLAGAADAAVHSAKDLPGRTADGLTLAAVPERADPTDALVGARLAELPPGAAVATGSARRRAQLAWRRPDLTFVELRGNIATRLRRLAEGPASALVMASAALDRLGVTPPVVERLSPSVMLPQVGQGAMAVECRSEDANGPLGELLASVEEPVTRRAVDTERAFLAELGGDCDLPAGAHATVAADGTITVEGLLASLDGHVLARQRRSGADPTEVGAGVARELRRAHPVD